MIGNILHWLLSRQTLDKTGIFSLNHWHPVRSDTKPTDLVIENALLRQQLKTRRTLYTRVIKYPTDEWTAQQLREATPWGKGTEVFDS